MPYYEASPLFETLAPAYDMLDRIWKLLQEDGQTLGDKQYDENLYAWHQLNRIHGQARVQLERM
jgi:hypothetical protein